MNQRRRSDSHTSSFIVFAGFLAAAFSAAGGILYTYYKNLQVQITQEIDKSNNRIENRRLDIRTSEMRMDQLLNRYAMRKQLKENGSHLRPIALSTVEEVTPTPPRRGGNVASNDKD